jgi:asparagine synthase (glutamine-hydrolysing)
MCGIAGFLRREPRRDDRDAAQLRAMAAQIAHRGPDDEDIFVGDGVGFAHRRLSVIDPSPHGRQPMRREHLVLAYNGEIYNFRELRRELEAAGEIFHTNSDTEVLLAAILRWDVGALTRLNGMFAIALWDERRRRLLLARDRIGKKPLYYASNDAELCFGSEIKALLARPGVPRTPNLRAIHHYLSLQYVPTPLTAFEGVMRVPPGHVLTIQQGGLPKVSSWWRLPSPQEARLDSADLKDRVLDGLRSAVRRRMVADVPVGAFLSGGVDSSAVAALMAESATQPVKTFCIGFEDAAYDERRYAKLVAERIGADHCEQVVMPDAVLLSEIAWHFGEPFADPSAIPTYLVSRLARNAVTVVLTGDGGDEFFLGYTRYAKCAQMRRLEQASAPMRAAAHALSGAIPLTAAAISTLAGAARRRLQSLSRARAERYEVPLMYFQRSDKLRAYGPRLRPFLSEPTPDLLAPYLDAAPDFVSGAAWADIHTYLPDDILTKLDVASMAHGLEARAPFLDVELMELASSIPAITKMPNGDLKGLLKEAVRPILPPEVLQRPKQGFAAPIDRWLASDLHDFALETLTSKSALDRGLFKQDYARAILAEHRWGARRHHFRIFALLMLELWFQAWIDSPPTVR